MTSVYNLYLSTLSSINPPLNKSNLANVHWNIDWSTLFNKKTGTSQVYVKLKSQKTVLLYDMNATMGTLRSNFSSPNSLVTNGVVIGLIDITEDPTDATLNYFFVENEQGITIDIPQFNSDFSVSFMDMTETLFLENIPEYEIMLTFVLNN